MRALTAWVRRPRLAALVVALVSCGTFGGTGQITRAVAPAPAALRTSTAAVTPGDSVWVTVAVATLWRSTTSPRSIDAKAVSAPVDIRGWLAAMSTSARLGLVGRVQTQVLYGERLLVTGVRAGWLHVVAVNQPTHLDARGYPGWVPRRQVTTLAPRSSSTIATVTRATAWLRDAAGQRVIEVSIGTRLPVSARAGTSVTVATPTRAALVVSSSAVAVRAPATAALTRSASAVTNAARLFVSRPYLWGGRSGFAVDCSGFTELVYGLVGMTIPRDTDDQARAGRAASLSAMRAGDLVFFREGSSIAHVGLYVGGGAMLHAPHTGSVVQQASIGHATLARRFL